MIQFSIPWLIEAIDGIEDLNRIEVGESKVGSLGDIFFAMIQIENIYQNTFYKNYLNVSRGAADGLYQILLKHSNETSDDVKFNDYEVAAIKDAKGKFRSLFLAELTSLPCFLVSKKEFFDLNVLLADGMKLFPEPLRLKAPETIIDVSEAARALAYELPTACGFHIFRVVEAVLRRYWDFVSGNEQRPEPQTLGRITAELEQKDFGEKKIIEALKQLTKLHRNPIAHPEYILSTEEAIGIVGMARSVVAPMLLALPENKTD